MQLPTDDYYAILQVDADASIDEIRTAYHRLALLHHPDKQLRQDQQHQQQTNTTTGNNDEDCPMAAPTTTSAASATQQPTDTRAFIRITEAWNTLRDDELRRIYDAEMFQDRIDIDVPMVHQVLSEDEVRRTADGTGLAYTCRCGSECQVDTHNRLNADGDDGSWRYSTCDECSHVVELDVQL